MAQIKSRKHSKTVSLVALAATLPLTQNSSQRAFRPFRWKLPLRTLIKKIP